MYCTALAPSGVHVFLYIVPWMRMKEGLIGVKLVSRSVVLDWMSRTASPKRLLYARECALNPSQRYICSSAGPGAAKYLVKSIACLPN
eukprot:2246065-Pyramimonas_sp.AAC.1